MSLEDSRGVTTYRPVRTRLSENTPGQLSSKSDLFQTSFLIFNRLSWDFAKNR